MKATLIVQLILLYSIEYICRILIKVTEWSLFKCLLWDYNLHLLKIHQYKLHMMNFGLIQVYVIHMLQYIQPWPRYEKHFIKCGNLLTYWEPGRWNSLDLFWGSCYKTGKCTECNSTMIRKQLSISHKNFKADKGVIFYNLVNSLSIGLWSILLFFKIWALCVILAG